MFQTQQWVKKYFYISKLDEYNEPIYSEGTFTSEWNNNDNPRDFPYQSYYITYIDTNEKEPIDPKKLFKVKTKGGKKSRRKLRRQRKSKKSN